MNKKNPADWNGIEGWMEQFFYDPFTSFLDQYTFRVDLFETSTYFIIEAELNDVQLDHIKVEINNETLKITKIMKPAEEDIQMEELNRTVILPFSIEQKEIDAHYVNGILEVKIAKEKSCLQKRKSIPIQAN
ncbi:Hsp20/alpha crystallin family protein [Metabacillus fastidiosus]|uniref:Hsp20/alpha crystallin family protein n=1 Tax=Metabacillus fastidiosus TaxID=1458 RepID=UPI003D2E3C24